ncbi:TadE/TadG family type IV pilus assembly protein [Streptomyces sp. AM 4-1-1]|nr:TadE/TadG family type IV pilus assembly protein [Streptomyces sp. AM 4-1-1]WEH37613.1 TadE/TadG family type IV pilus assembly protein [Streptomyces sp. AM 4-1-1]
MEYLGFLPVLLLIGLAGIQLGLVAYTAQQAGTAARAAARTASQQETAGQYARVGTSSMSGWLADGATFSVGGGDAVTVTVTVDVPSLFPGLHPSVTKSATMPSDRSVRHD